MARSRRPKKRKSSETKLEGGLKKYVLNKYSEFKDIPCSLCLRRIDYHTVWLNCITNGHLIGGAQYTPMGNLEYIVWKGEQKC